MPRGPGRKVPYGVLFECLWAPGSLGVPQRVLFECFLALLGLKKLKKSTQKALKRHSLRHSEPGAQKALLGGTVRPGLLGTPANGERDLDERQITHLICARLKYDLIERS